MARILVAMSGGVDSSMAAAHVAGRGDEAVGVTLHLGGTPDEAAPGRCCSARDSADARAVADRLGFPHYVLDMEEEFERRVIRPFADAYLAGRTPVPCADCNVHLKFDRLLERALALGARKVATGHYARIRFAAGRWRLLRAAHRDKDQSHFLYALTQREMAAVEFPLGEMSKDEVRAQAAAAGLVTADKPDSQDLCFVGAGGYGAVLRRYAGNAGRAGTVVDAAGTQLGRHDDYTGFTVGQRRGLGVAAAQPLYVIRVDPATRTVTAGSRAESAAAGLGLEDVSFTHPAMACDGLRCVVAVRHRARPEPARLLRAGRSWRVVFDAPVEAAAPGQAAVFYRGEEVLGGGRIGEVER